MQEPRIGEPLRGELETGRGSFKISRNAKGETQFEVKTYALGDTAEDENNARERAAAHFDELVERYPL